VNRVSLLPSQQRAPRYTSLIGLTRATQAPAAGWVRQIWVMGVRSATLTLGLLFPLARNPPAIGSQLEVALPNCRNDVLGCLLFSGNHDASGEASCSGVSSRPDQAVGPQLVLLRV